MNLNQHGGNLRELAKRAKCNDEDILDFSASINPLGFPSWLRMFVNSQISSLIHYPDIDYQEIKEGIASFYDINIENITIGNGSSEILYKIPLAVSAQKAILPVPSYLDYEKVIKLFNIPYEYFFLNEHNDFDFDFERFSDYLKCESAVNTLVFLGNPNNPTGRPLDKRKILNLIQSNPNLFFVVDEAFVDFCNSEQSIKKCKLPNLIILCSMTKILGVPGLRLGFSISSGEIKNKIDNHIPPWTLNSIASSVFKRSFEDKSYYIETRSKVRNWRESLIQELRGLCIFKVFESEANYLLLKILSDEHDSSSLCESLLKNHKIAIRDCQHYVGLDNAFVRIAVKSPEENEKLLDGIRACFKMKSIYRIKKKPALMFLGTGSNVGKSILTTALCRVMSQDGFRVAPFKAQNMALNSFVTPEGGEIGRAQALQAQAANVIPDVRMNPILLKPSNEFDSQVIIHGKPVSHMTFKSYSKYKPEAFEEVKKSYDSLAEEYDCLVLEGAGSVSEVNLKHNDLVNMRMAQYANANVILIGNIDQGGVFGSYIGSLETLFEWERKLVKGFIINRFRGDLSLLEDGLDYLENNSKRHVYGVVPYLKNLALPEEDSLEFKLELLNDTTPLGNRLDVALIDTPRISNFTDVDALKVEKDVRVRQVKNASDLGQPDLIILAGSKNVAMDLAHIKENGLAQRIVELAQQGNTHIVGICGGYQMLGERILDPEGIESQQPCVEGLGLLPIETTMESDKFLGQSTAIHIESGISVSGYEIHHGRTEKLREILSILKNPTGQILGHGNQEGTVWGTYLHGIFDCDRFRRWYLNKIRFKKSLHPIDEITAYDLNKNINILADHFRKNVEVSGLYELMGL